MAPFSRRRYARSTARFTLIRRLTIAQCLVSVVGAVLSIMQLKQLQLTASMSSLTSSVWIAFAAWRDLSMGTSRLLDPRVLSASVDHHLLRALLAGAAVMLLTWSFVRGPEQQRKDAAMMAVTMQVLATLSVANMFIVRNAFNHLVTPGAPQPGGGGKGSDTSDIEVSDMEAEPPPNEAEKERRTWARALSQTLPRGWRQHAPHRQQWEPPSLPLLSAHNSGGEANLTTLDEEARAPPCPYISPCHTVPRPRLRPAPATSPPNPTIPTLYLPLPLDLTSVSARPTLRTLSAWQRSPCLGGSVGASPCGSTGTKGEGCTSPISFGVTASATSPRGSWRTPSAAEQRVETRCALSCPSSATGVDAEVLHHRASRSATTRSLSFGSRSASRTPPPTDSLLELAPLLPSKASPRASASSASSPTSRAVHPAGPCEQPHRSAKRGIPARVVGRLHG